jgi:WD40 repeat protein
MRVRARRWRLSARSGGVVVVIGVAILALTVAFVTADRNGATAGSYGRSNGRVVMQPGPATPPVPFITNSRLLGLPNGRDLPLDGQAHAGLAGWTSPVGVMSPDGSSVVYDAWTDLVTIDPVKSYSQQGITDGQPLAEPSLRVIDTTTGTDTLLINGAYSFAWRMDGAVAFVKGTDTEVKANVPYTGDIVVRESLNGPDEVWTSSPDYYVAVAWAEQTLLAYRIGEGESADLRALSGPGQSRLIAADATLVAVSPDGTRALISQSSAGAASVIDVATGSTLANLDLLQTLDPTTGEPLGYLAYAGSWVGDRVAAEGGSGIVILDVTSSKLSLHSVLSLPSAQFPMHPHEPRFIDTTGSSVIAWVPIPGSGGQAPGRLYLYLNCNVDDAVCRVGPTRGSRVFYPVSNPSRPLSDSTQLALSSSATTGA